MVMEGGKVQHQQGEQQLQGVAQAENDQDRHQGVGTPDREKGKGSEMIGGRDGSRVIKRVIRGDRRGREIGRGDRMRDQCGK